jgi:uncharacterized protein (DUF1015 family)
MSAVYPLRGFRPRPDVAAKVASPPYDVLDSDEARKMAGDNPLSFLRVVKPEITVDPSLSPYDDRVYAAGRNELRRLIAEGVIVQDDQPCFYAYAQRMGEHRQIGLMAAVSVEEYEQGLIKKHEFTRPDKEADRTRHIVEGMSQNGPVFLAYRASDATHAAMEALTAGEPVVDFVADDGIQHTLWVASDAAKLQGVTDAFAATPALYIADGHHRSASALNARDQLREAAGATFTGEEPCNRFLAVIFPDDELRILAYNRVVEDLDGRSADELLEQISAKFEVDDEPCSEPERSGCFGIYLGDRWRRLTARPGTFDDTDAVARLDAAILQANLLEPLLGIDDPRTNSRIKFVGGIRGTAELERLVDSGDFAVAFSLHATTMDQLFTVADADRVMPPKSTWFEPKLRSGMVIHLLDG